MAVTSPLAQGHQNRSHPFAGHFPPCPRQESNLDLPFGRRLPFSEADDAVREAWLRLHLRQGSFELSPTDVGHVGPRRRKGASDPLVALLQP